MTFVEEKPKCTFNFIIKSKYACPVPQGPQINTCPMYPIFYSLLSSPRLLSSFLLFYFDKYIYVYLVPHSHDDVGWTQTADVCFSLIFIFIILKFIIVIIIIISNITRRRWGTYWTLSHQVWLPILKGSSFMSNSMNQSFYY